MTETQTAREGHTLEDVGITLDMVLAAVEADDYLGFCVACAAEAYQVEPDARAYRCESCGDRAVYGAEELLILSVA